MLVMKIGVKVTFRHLPLEFVLKMKISNYTCLGSQDLIFFLCKKYCYGHFLIIRCMKDMCRKFLYEELTHICFLLSAWLKHKQLTPPLWIEEVYSLNISFREEESSISKMFPNWKVQMWARVLYKKTSLIL